MGSKFLFSVLALCLVGFAVFWMKEGGNGWGYAIMGMMAVVMALLFRSVIMPKHTVAKGLSLIASQDFNNRLTKVGERDSDRIVGLFNTMIDKLRNERLLNIEREGFLQLLIDASPMGVATLDFDGRISMANEAFLKMTGLGSLESVAGKGFDELDFDLRDSLRGVALGGESVIRRGDIRMYRCYHLNFIQSGFRREFYLLESLTEEIMKAERAAYEKVIRIISHEVNNTMGGVRSVLDTIGTIVEDEEVERVIESCDNRCEQLCGFISSYADVVRVPDPVVRRNDLADDIGKLMPFLREMVREDIELNFKAEAASLEASYDKALMEQVVVNVVKNAAESIHGDGGRIEILAIEDNENAIVEIANNGDAITEEVSAQLFRPFFSTKREGRGLGLTLVGEILNRHKAHFSLRTYPDGLTRFRIQLPSSS
ncbi:MAG: PAS domain-containing protein [Muribaculaceae bacterium]